ncbi:MAG: hypothetical protein FJY88_12470, partial [Candidatus Eisenbacteria bacterium]|nr:hypothetical protein [Candidatus Eisenbacteria bacterium]
MARRIRVSVEFEDSGSANEKVSSGRPIPPSFDSIYRKLIVNYPLLSGGIEIEPGAWVLICPNDTQVTTRLQPLVDWRKRMGYPVTVATTAQTGTTNTAIKSWIQNAYDTWEIPPEHIVLAGDVTGTYVIPTWYETLSGYGGEGDHPYTQLDGADILPEVHIGRLSFQTLTELDVIVNKITGYESNPLVSDPNWFRGACLAGDVAASGISVWQIQQWIKVRLRQLGYTPIDTVYSGDFVSVMRNAMNRGIGILSYRGTIGMSGWSNSNTYQLTNGMKLPFVVTITCGTGSFTDNSCLTEGFLRANASGSPKGAVAAIGTATTGTHTRYNNCIHGGIFQGLLYEDLYNLGAALTRGKLELFLNYQAHEPNQVTIWCHWNNLMGDPAVDCWTGTPQTLTVTHPASLPIGANSVTVTVRRSGIPEADVKVCLLKEDFTGTETQVYGWTDSNGEVELPVTATRTGTMLVTATKHDRKPYLSAITVAAAARFAAYEASAIDDDASGGSIGNGDGLVNPGERIELRVQLRNRGSQNLAAVTAGLGSADPYVTILDGQETFGDIAAGATAWCMEDFDVEIDPGCPDGHQIRFGLEVSSGPDLWHSLIDLPVVAAELTGVSATINDLGGNGILDPGETATMVVTLRNDGHATASNVLGRLAALSPYLVVVDGSGSFGTLAVGQEGNNSSNLFSVSAAAETFPGHLATFAVEAEFSGGVRDTALVTVPVGQRSSDDPAGPDAYGYYAFDNTDTAYPDAPAYAWVEVDPEFGGFGWEVALTDYGPNLDDTERVDLPFPFTYYGQTYNRISVCSNGWIVMGWSNLSDHRNWTIPGAVGPQGIIAAFWDDIHLIDGGQVFTWHDTANHRFVIEWSRVLNDMGGPQTFEIILYDPAYHETMTGDGPIVFQYMTVTNNDYADNYATTGIESPDGTTGVLYTFYSDYAPGAATLATGRAIRFVPVLPIPLGSVSGYVGNGSAGGTPITGAQVRVQQTGRTFLTTEGGQYGGSHPAGTYTLIASHAGFEPDTALGVVIAVSQPTLQDFELIDNLGPFITTTLHASTTDTLGPYTIPVTITDASGVASQTLRYRGASGAYAEAPLVSQGGDSYLAEIPGQSYLTRVEYYVVARDVAERESLDPPGAPAFFHSFFVAPETNLFADEMEIDQGWTVGAPDDDATTGIWERVDPVGTYVGSDPVQPEDDHTPDPGTFCFVTGQASAADPGLNDVDGGKTTLTSPLLNLSSYGTVRLEYYRWYTNDMGNNPGQDSWVVQVSEDDGQSWVDLENTTASARSWTRMEFDLGDYISLTPTARLRFVASDYPGGSLVEAGVDDVRLLLTGVVGAPETNAGPSVFS